MPTTPFFALLKRTIAGLVNSGVATSSSAQLSKKVRLANSMALAFCLMGAIYTGVFAAVQALTLAAAVFACVVLYASVLWLNSRGKTMHGRLLLLLTFHTAIAFFGVAVDEDTRQVTRLLAFPQTMMPFLLFDLRERKLIVVGVLAGISAYALPTGLAAYFPGLQVVDMHDKMPKDAAVPMIFLIFTTVVYAMARETSKLEESLSATTKRLLLQQAVAPAGIIEFASNGQILDWNPGAEALFGYTRAAALQLNFGRLLAAEIRAKPGFGEGWQRLLQSSGPLLQESLCQHQDGHVFHAEARIVAIRSEDQGATGILAFVYDVSKRIEQQRLLDEQKIKAMSSAKLATLGEMASGVAHEINNPLAIIAGKARAGRKAFKDQSAVADIFTAIEQMTLRIAKIITGLQAFAREADSDPLEPCQVGKVVQDAVELCREKIRSGDIELREAVIAPEILVSGRSVQLSQVVLNLLSNAVDALSERQGGAARPFVAMQLVVDEAWVRLEVANNGPRIPEALLGKIMQPFFTTKPVGKGTGLGLSIASGIATSHGGSLTVKDADGITTFALSLPRLTPSGLTLTAAANAS